MQRERMCRQTRSASRKRRGARTSAVPRCIERSRGAPRAGVCASTRAYGGASAAAVMRLMAASTCGREKQVAMTKKRVHDTTRDTSSTEMSTALVSLAAPASSSAKARDSAASRPEKSPSASASRSGSGPVVGALGTGSSGPYCDSLRLALWRLEKHTPERRGAGCERQSQPPALVRRVLRASARPPPRADAAVRSATQSYARGRTCGAAQDAAVQRGCRSAAACSGRAAAGGDASSMTAARALPRA
jgi:hypothetical protein